LSGIDAQVTLGYDIYKKSDHDYLGFGVSLGIATPTIENSGGSDSSSSNTANLSIPIPIPTGLNPVELLSSSTDMFGYKLGPALIYSKSFGSYTSFYAKASYALQTMSIENDTINSGLDVNGTCLSYGIGMRYQLARTEADLGFMTLEPGLYMNFGVNYTELRLDDFIIDLTGNNFDLEDSELNSSATTLYFGLGYEF